MHKNLITTNMILYCKEWEKTVRFYRDQLHLPVNFSTDWFAEIWQGDLGLKINFDALWIVSRR